MLLPIIPRMLPSGTKQAFPMTEISMLVDIAAPHKVVSAIEGLSVPADNQVMSGDPHRANSGVSVIAIASPTDNAAIAGRTFASTAMRRGTHP